MRDFLQKLKVHTKNVCDDAAFAGSCQYILTDCIGNFNTPSQEMLRLLVASLVCFFLKNKSFHGATPLR